MQIVTNNPVVKGFNRSIFLLSLLVLRYYKTACYDLISFFCFVYNLGRGTGYMKMIIDGITKAIIAVGVKE